MKAADRIIERATAPSRRRKFIRSLEETAARAVVTATVTFAVGWVLKKMFERSVAEAAEEGAKAGAAEADASAQDATPPGGSA